MIQLNYKVGHEDSITGLWVTSFPNSIGAFSVEFSIKNLDARPIKYYHLTFVPYNNVNEPVIDVTIQKIVQATVTGTGPLSQNAKQTKVLKNAWYDPSITHVKLKEAKIEYMDGSTEIIKGEDVKPISSGGCYVATAVYGSYDCPEVWTLRRFRDYTLAETWYGRAFIRLYYAISPTLVKWFGKTQWFRNMWKPKLDKMVSNLNAKGIEDTPYDDKLW